MIPIRIGLIGSYQSGKSLLVNCLLKRRIATVGNGTATTHTVVFYYYSKSEYAEYIDATGTHRLAVDDLNKIDTQPNVKSINIYVNCDFLKDYVLIDMPGTDYNSTDNKTADWALDYLDFGIVVGTNYKELPSQSDFFLEINKLGRKRIPYYFFINCINSSSSGYNWHPCDEDNINLANKALQLLHHYPPMTYPFEKDQIPIVNIMWYWRSLISQDDEITKRLKAAFNIYTCNEEVTGEEFYQASNFQLLEQIFSMENKMYLELKRDFKQELAKLRDEVCPVGTIQAFAFDKAPEGWLPCDGRTLDAEDYPELFNAIDFTFGGNGKTEFVIPDLRGRFVRGWDDKAYIDKDRLFGSSQDDSFQGHEHKIQEMEIYDGQHYHHVYTNDCGSYHSEEVYKLRCPGRYHDYSIDRCMPMDEGIHKHTIPSHASTAVLDSDGDGKARIANETRPKNIALLYCIKAINSNNVKPRTIFQSEIELNNLYKNDGQFTGFVALFSSFAIKDNGNVIRNRVANVIVVDNDEITKKGCLIERDFKIGDKGVYFMKFTRDKIWEDITMVLEKVHTFGIIGDFNKWEKSVEMQLDTSRLCYYCTLKLKKGDKFKFRANNKWAIEGGIELDGDPNNLSLEKTKDIECKESGEYAITLDIQTHPWHCTLKKLSS